MGFPRLRDWTQDQEAQANTGAEHELQTPALPNPNSQKKKKHPHPCEEVTMAMVTMDVVHTMMQKRRVGGG